MSERRLLAVGVLSAVAILAIIGIVRAMEGPVDQVGQAVASTLRSRPLDVDFTVGAPWGLPRWALIIDNAIGVLLLAIMFLGGLPLGVVAIGLGLFRRSLVHRRLVVARLAPYCLVFQVSSLCLASTITAVALLVGGSEPFLEPLTWYHVATVVVSIVAIPVWRQRIQPTTFLPTIFTERPV